MRAGELVPDQLIDDLMAERLAKPDTRSGFILDGYPRTCGQAHALTEVLHGLQLSLTAAVLFDASDADVVRRLSGRRSCPTCGRVYHVEFGPPAQSGRCDRDGEQLVRRDDDAPETIHNRLTAYRRETGPVAEYYRERARCCPSTRRETRTRFRLRCARRWRSTPGSVDVALDRERHERLGTYRRGGLRYQRRDRREPVSADRGLRLPVGLRDLRAGGAERQRRVDVPAAVRLAERVRRDPGPRRRHVPARPRRRRGAGRAALPAGHDGAGDELGRAAAAGSSCATSCSSARGTTSDERSHTHRRAPDRLRRRPRAAAHRCAA